MAQDDRRFKTLRKSTREMLAGGEQAHVEFKSQVPSSIAQQASAGANYVALNPSVELHTILIGVEEKTLSNGSRIGSVVGCRNSRGEVEDLDQMRLKLEQMIRDGVTPPPRIAIFEEGTATNTPILVVEIRPTEPPHRVGDRYQIRGTGGLTALTQHDALQLFRNQRTRAWIDELEPGNPLLSVLVALQMNYEEIAFELRELAEEPGSSERAEEVSHSIGDVGGVLEQLSEIQATLERIEEFSSVAEARTGAILGHLDGSPAKVWFDLRTRREMCWFKVQQAAAFGGFSPDELLVIERFVREHFSEEPALIDYGRNLAEYHGYDLTFTLDSDARGPSDFEAVAEFVGAAVGRAEGVPRRFSRDWITEGKKERQSIHQLRAIVANTGGRRPRTIYTREIAILILSELGQRALATHAWATNEPDSLAIRWETDQGVLRCGLSTDGETIGAIYEPRWGVLGVQSDRPRSSRLAAEIAKIVRGHSGRVLRVDGPGRIFKDQARPAID